MNQSWISSDSHLVEPPDLWTSRMSAALQEQAPQVVRIDDHEWWMCEGRKAGGFHTGNQTGDRFTKPKEMHRGGRFEEVRPGGFDPVEHLRDNETDGIVASVLYPSAGASLYGQLRDLEVLKEVCRVYNDWLADYWCSTDPDRLKGVAMIVIEDVEGSVAELERARNLGLCGALIPTSTGQGKPYDDPSYEPLWAAAEDLEMPLSMHLGTNRFGSGGLDSENLLALRPSLLTTGDYWVKRSMTDVIFAGVLDRHPRLRIGSVEHELGWIPHFLDRMDYTYTQRTGNALYPRFADGALPSDLFRRQVFCSFQDDALGIHERYTIGLDNIMFGSDYPHPESTYPRSRSIMEERLKDVDQVEREKITVTNVAALYEFDLDRLHLSSS